MTGYLPLARTSRDKGFGSFHEPAGIELLGGIRHVDKMMGQPGARFEGRLGRSDIHVTEDLQGIRVDNLEPCVEQGEKKIGLSNSRGAEDDDDGEGSRWAGFRHPCLGRAFGIREYPFGANAVQLRGVPRKAYGQALRLPDADI